MSPNSIAPHHRPSAPRAIGLIVKRELGTYFRSRSGYVISALILLLDGLMFNAWCVGSTPRPSSEVLSSFLYCTSGVVMVAAILISMRLIAEDRQSGALPLLTTSSLSDGEIIMAKYLSGCIFLALLTLVTLYMPALIFINGKVSLAHIAGGYIGLLCLGSAAIAIGTFGSAVSPSQVVAVIVSSALVVFLLLQWQLAPIVEGPLSNLISYLALHDKHFRPFMEGVISLRDILFYLSLSAFFLVLARNSLEARRWKP